MAKITAKSRPGKLGQVSIEGRLDDAALLLVETVLHFGHQVRATMAQAGVTQLEPEGEEPNDFALAMAHMQRAVVNREAPKEEGDDDVPPTTH